jgi:EF hand
MMTATNHRYVHRLFKKPTPRAVAYYFYAGGVLAAIAASAVLVATQVNAQTEPPAAVEANKAAGITAPKYGAQDIERAFGFIDANKDGKISREEASGFRNIAKYFDVADINQDGALTLVEFGMALNKP